MGDMAPPTTDANEVQHDAVLDYYGRRLATCSSDKTIKIFEVEGEKHTLVETLRGYVTSEAAAIPWNRARAMRKLMLTLVDMRALSGA
jgi:hypothetical protein